MRGFFFQRELNDVRVGLPRGVNCCRSEGVFFQRELNDVRVGLPRALKWCKSEGVICPGGGG